MATASRLTRMVFPTYPDSPTRRAKGPTTSKSV